MMAQTRTQTKIVACALLLAFVHAGVPQMSADEIPGSGGYFPGGSRDSSHLWMRTDYLLWWTQGSRVPALVTTSPPGTPVDDAGILGVDGTQVLFGGNSLNDSVRSGVRVQGGLWLDDDESRGIDFHYLGLESQGQFFRQDSSDDDILTRPLVDANTGQPAAELAAFPGTICGSLAAAVRSEGLYSWGGNFRCRFDEFCSRCDGRERLDFVFGYRTANLADQVRVRERLTSPLFAAGTHLFLVDDFATRNIFHGANLGLRYQKQKEFLQLNSFANVAFGSTSSRTAIDGRTQVNAPGVPSFDDAGGLYALTSNIGQTSRNEFTTLFDVGFDAGLRVHQQFEIHVGYTFLFWPNVYRAGDQIDTTINPNLLPPPIPGAGNPARPALRNKSTNFWAQGISFGFEYRY